MRAKTTENSPRSNWDSQTTTVTLLHLTRELLKEVHRGHAVRHPALDSKLDDDLGLDSLSRMELFARVEKHFRISLPDQALREIDTLRDLLRVLEKRSAAPQPGAGPALATTELETLTVTPDHAETLIDVLEWHIRSHAQREHIRLYQDDGNDTVIDYAMLYRHAGRVAAGLQARGLRVGDTVALMLPTGSDYFYCFYGVLLAGLVPVPIYPPVRISQLEDHLKRQRSILQSCQTRTLITFNEARKIARLLQTQVEQLDHVITPQELLQDASTYQRPVIGAKHTAFLQYTSGSTGDPKGVVLTHANLLSNIRAMGQVIEATPQDVFISWLPLYHDMGLIGAWLGSLYYSMRLVIMSPLAFLSKPQRWLHAVHRYRGTLSAAPNFAFEYCVKRITDADLEGLDLSSWRVAFNGAEPVSMLGMRRFIDRFASHGFNAIALTPVYGLAENSLGVTFPPMLRGLLADNIDRDVFSTQGRAVPCAQGNAHALQFVSCGQPLPGHQVRVVDEHDAELPDRYEGEVQFQGPSATGGYFRNATATASLFHGAWLDSGDMGYIAAGDLYITGRKKDLIIRGGRNIYPQELEEAIGDLEGIRKGCVAVFGSRDKTTEEEKLVVLAETKTPAHAQAALLERVRQRAIEIAQVNPDDIVLAPPHTVLKTSSGKMRRNACKERYESGRIGKRSALWRQIIRIAASAVQPLLKSRWRKLKRASFNVYFYANLAVLAPIGWLGIMLLPGIETRWRWTRLVLNLLTRATGIRIQTSGVQDYPYPVIYAANHASYIDSLVLSAVLRKSVCFVAKSELRQSVLHPALKRLGVMYVERYDIQKSAADAQLLRQGMNQGQSMVMFPEGTFTRVPGVLPFHLGAFLTAIETNTPIVPVALRGTRNILRGEDYYFHHGHIRVHFFEPVTAQPFLQHHPEPFQAALAMRDAVRARILQQCGEPDLGYEKNPAPGR